MMRREDQRNATDRVEDDMNDAPIDLTKKTENETKSANHKDILENKNQTSPEWQIPPFYPPVFFLGGESTFRTFPAVAMANPFLLPYYPVLYEQLGFRYAMKTDPAFDNVLSNHCLYRTASDTYLKDHVLQNNREEYGRRRHNNTYEKQVAISESIETNGYQPDSDIGINSLRKCKSLGALSNDLQEETCTRSLSCPDLNLKETYKQSENNGPRDKKMKMDLPYRTRKFQTGEDQAKHRRQDKFDLSAECRSRSMPSVSQGDQESFLQKLRHVAPAGFPCNVYGYYTHLMQKYQDHEELKRHVGIIQASTPPDSPGPEAGKKRPTRTLTGKHVRHGTGASPSTLLTLRHMIQERQRAKELAQNYGITTKCKVNRKNSNKSSSRRPT